jgi:CII-binding regulator of phage lambda lysogenization HflD
MINSRVVKSFVVQSLVREEKMHVTSEIMEKLGNRVQTLQQQFSATWTPAHKKHQLHHSILFVTQVYRTIKTRIFAQSGWPQQAV